MIRRRPSAPGDFRFHRADPSPSSETIDRPANGNRPSSPRLAVATSSVTTSRAPSWRSYSSRRRSPSSSALGCLRPRGLCAVAGDDDEPTGKIDIGGVHERQIQLAHAERDIAARTARDVQEKWHAAEQENKQLHEELRQERLERERIRIENQKLKLALKEARAKRGAE